MSTQKSKRSNPTDAFYLHRIVRNPDTNSFIALAQHLRTGDPVEATISLQQVFRGLQRWYSTGEEAFWYLRRLEDDNLIEPLDKHGKPLRLMADELVHLGFDPDNVLRLARS